MEKKFSLSLSIFLLMLVTAASSGGQQAPTPSQPKEQPQQPAAAQKPPSPSSQASPPAPQQAQPPSAPKVEPPAPQATQPARPPERRLLPPPAVARSADMVSLNFNRAELVEVIHVLAQHLRLTYTIDPEVKGTVTINSAEPLKREDLFPIFHQVLRMNGVVAVKTGEMYRIAPIKDGKGLARPVGEGKEDGYALQVMPVRFFSVGEMKKLLTPFVTPGGEILDYPRGNFLIVVDLPSNIQRLMEIRDLIDVNVFSGTRMEVYQPKVASAEELATEMTKIMQLYAASAAQAEGFAAQFLAVPRVNQLLVISHSEAAWTYVKRWLERIDTVGEGPGRRIFIYPVENGKATELADTLNQVLGQAPVSRRELPRTLQDLHRGTPTGPGAPGALRPGLPSLGAPGMAPSTGSQVPPYSAFAVAPAPGQPPAVTPTPPALTPTPPAQAGARPQEQLRIVPDPATNSLIVYGTAQEFQNIKNILRDLDIIPRQVLLDVLVAEVTLTDNEKFGLEYEILRKEGDVRIFNREFGSRASILTGLVGSATSTGPTPGPQVLSGVIGTQDVRSFINVLMSDSRVKVLSSPSILATDNRPARIQVGTEEPIPTGTIQSATTGSSISQSTTIQYRNTGRILTIIPQVNSQGLVHLQIKAEVSQRGADVQVGTADNKFPSFDTRDAETTAVVQDGETLVMGGIIADRTSRSRTGIPYLMDIPVLGRFFGTTTDDINRTELVMLITPHVIRNLNEAKSVTEEFKEKLSTVTREIERMKKERTRVQEEQSPIPQKPASPGGEQKSGKTPAEQSGVFQRPPDLPGEKTAPGSEARIRGIKLAASGNGEFSSLPQGVSEAVREVSEETEVAESEPAPQEIWRSILKILSFGLL